MSGGEIYVLDYSGSVLKLAAQFAVVLKAARNEG